MTGFLFGKRSWKLVLAGGACGLSAAMVFAEEQPPLEAAPEVEMEASVLVPDEELGPIFRLPETSPDEPSDDAPEWKPNWRQPAPARSTPRSVPIAVDAFAPPEIELPVGTDAPPVEPEPTKSGSSRRRHGNARASSNSATPHHSAAPSLPPDHRPSRAMSTGRSAHVATPEIAGPVEVEIPGITDLGESATLPEPQYAPQASAEKKPPARRGFMARIFRTTPAAPTAEAPARPARTGWGGFLFRNGPVSR